jgi:hypothetical protein
MKRPLIAFGISVAMIFLGSAVCLPGICGCYSWLGVPEFKYSDLFLFVFMGGLIGVCLSLAWLAAAAVQRALRTRT